MSTSVRIPVPAGYIDTLSNDPGSLPEPIRDALLRVRRHRFLDGWFHLEIDNLQANFRFVDFDRNAPSREALEEIYSNRALVTVLDGPFPTSSTSQPSLVARMLQLLGVRPGMRILEIGTGTGYNAALLAELSGEPSHVFTIECQHAVAEKARRFLREEGYGDVHVVHADGFQGIQGEAPFDRIVATVGCSDVSPHWLEQLSPDGVMLIPLQHGYTDPLVRLTHDPNDPQSAQGGIVDRSGFMKIQGVLDWSSPWQPSGMEGLPEDSEWCRPLPDNLALPTLCAHPLDADIHQSFHFFLSLCSQELWYDNTGYGLADSGDKTIVKFTVEGIEGYSANRDPEPAQRVYERLLSLHRSWVDLGCPSPYDYSLRLSLKNRFGDSSCHPMREWTIERPCFLETLRLT